MTPILRIRRLIRRFDDVIVLDGIEFDVARGQRLGLAGSNGSGRTTLLRIAAALLPASSGTIEVAGIDASRSPLEARTQALYVDSSLPAGDSLRVGEYMTFIKKARVGRTRSVMATSTNEAIERAGLHPDAAIDTLSAAGRKQVALAAAMLVAPPLLLLDDPLNGLDAAARAVFVGWMREVSAAGGTMLTAVNDSDTDSGVYDSAICLSQGRIVPATRATVAEPTQYLMTAGAAL